MNSSWVPISTYLPEVCFNCYFFKCGYCTHPYMSGPNGEELQVPDDFKCDSWVDHKSIISSVPTLNNCSFNAQYDWTNYNISNNYTPYIFDDNKAIIKIKTE